MEFKELIIKSCLKAEILPKEEVIIKLTNAFDQLQETEREEVIETLEKFVRGE